MNRDLAETIDRLNADLISTYENETKLFERLTQVQSDLGLLYGDRPTCPFLRPHFLHRSQYHEIVQAAETIAAAEERLTAAALEDETILDHLDLTDSEKHLAKIEPGYQTVSTTARLDTFVSGNDFKFLEYNGETPAGVGDQTQLEQVLNNIPLVREFLDENPHWRPKPHGRLLNALFSSYREFGGKKGKPNIAIVDWEGVSTESEFFILKDYFESMGFPTIVLDPSEVEYDGTCLRAESFEIDILYKRVLIQELLVKFGLEHPIIKAYEDGNLCLCNSFRVKIPHKKIGFSILTDEEYSKLFTTDQHEIIRKHIPWTRKVAGAKTKYHGQEIDLIPFIAKKRENFLLKPNDDYGGKGIVLGWEVSDGIWETAINDALKDSFVVQERAAIEKQFFPVYDENVTNIELLVDFDPFLFQGKVEGGLVRLSSSSLVNVTQGGGQTALIVLE